MFNFSSKISAALNMQQKLNDQIDWPNWVAKFLSENLTNQGLGEGLVCLG